MAFLIWAGILAGVFVFMTFPYKKRKERVLELAGWHYAHRGLFDPEAGIPENSMPAFEKALEEGYGIELDVRMTADNQFVVLHDRNLKRAAGVDALADEKTLRELSELTLFGTELRVPIFYEVLKTVDGKVPLLIEVKCEKGMDYKEIVRELVFYLDGYEGKVLIESFHPGILAELARQRPQYLRGQLSERFPEETLLAKAFTICLFNFLAKPDFISYRINDSGSAGFILQRYIYRSVMAGWTVRDADSLKALKGIVDLFIFEGFRPEDGKGGGKACGRERSMKGIVRKHLYVSGEVQGVGFRYHASYAAQRYGVTGWVKNLYDDRVEMEVQGSEENIGRLLESVGSQRFVRITDIESEYIPVQARDYEFKVRY
ncbi:MAG: acylphosphatase [Lachnospiraceae bacterium]|nr:acylphosphatase [Lachnospiraceae bacterium]